MILRPRHLIPLLLLAACGNCVADIYGFVDENGVVHISNAPLDPRYFLFKKELPPEPDEGALAETDQPAPGTTYVNPAYRMRYSPLVAAVARKYKLDVALLHAVIAVESGYDPNAISPKGAVGLMQLMPETARRYDVNDVRNPAENVHGGARYLRDLLKLFNNNLNLALAAYNAGEAAVIQAGYRIPRIAETLSYVPRVLQHYRQYRTSANF